MKKEVKIPNIKNSSFNNLLFDYVKIINYVTNNDFDNLDNNLFFNILNKIYLFELDVNDLCLIFGNVFNKEYNKYQIINTSMVTDDWELALYEKVDKYQIIYSAIISDEVNELNDVVDLGTLFKLLKNDDIVLLNEYKIISNNNTVLVNDYVAFDKMLKNNIDDIGFYKISVDDKYFNHEVDYLKSVFSKTVLLKDLKLVICSIVDQLNYIFDNDSICEINKYSYYYDSYADNCFKKFIYQNRG